MLKISKSKARNRVEAFVTEYGGFKGCQVVTQVSWLWAEGVGGFLWSAERLA